MAIDEKGGGVNFTSFKQTNKDMEYHLWLEYLIQTACAIFCIDPSEVGYLIKGGGGTPLYEHSGAVKLDFSKDKGLRPLLKFYQHIINKNIVQRMYSDLYFEWVGADAMSESDKVEVTSKKIQSGLMTVNEARALDDMPQIEEGWANAPAHATLAQVYLKDKENEQAQLQQAMAPQPGQPGAEGQPPQPGAEAGQPPAQPGQPPQAGAPKGGGEVPPELHGLEPKADLDTSMRMRRGKDKNSPEFADARKNEKEQKEKKEEKKHLGINVYKSENEDEEIVEIDFK